MDKALFRSFMVKNCDTQAKLAEYMGISLSCLNAKINGKGSDFHQNEIKAIAKRYCLTMEDIEHIFFAS